MTESALQYFHAVFNNRYFLNELDPVIIKVTEKTNEYNDVVATFQQYWNIIVFFYDPADYDDPNVFLKESDPIYLLTVLFHEMIHQWCYICGIDDIDEYGDHSDAFREEAERYGMTQSGYNFSEKMKAEIKEMTESYFSICEKVIPGLDKFF